LYFLRKSESPSQSPIICSSLRKSEDSTNGKGMAVNCHAAIYISVPPGTVYAIKPARQWAFVSLFTHGPLGKKLMRHYMNGAETPRTITLTIDEMVEVGAVAPPSDSRPSITRTDDFETYRQRLSSGPVQIQDMRMDLIATEGATLGQFRAYLSGTLRGSPSDWSFEGTMRYHDFYNYEHHQGGSWMRNFYVFGVRSGVNGTSFPVESDLAPAKQTSHDREIQWQGTGVQNSPRPYEN